MKRTTAIAKAKEAYRLFITRGIVTSGLEVYPEGYVFKCEGWNIVLKDNGALNCAAKEG